MSQWVQSYLSGTVSPLPGKVSEDTPELCLKYTPNCILKSTFNVTSELRWPSPYLDLLSNDDDDNDDDEEEEEEGGTLD
ncbi:unnamed protein product [Schistocephalus solidus]|uniref:Uncharacterized protein n=1 Tax=Schistocephalus solidus TaxID=70667 RepID=A0A183SPB0_SCHSO|nr:unnamed protein product [Schistocephalus solidus]